MTRRNQQDLDPADNSVVETDLADPVTPALGAARVGDTVDVGAAAAYVRLPDGTVVTCRGTYTARHEGEHIVFVVEDGKTTETKVMVAKASGVAAK